MSSPLLLPPRIGYTYAKELLAEFKKDTVIDATEGRMIVSTDEDGVTVWFTLEKTAKDFKRYVANNS